jgi:hypothetical protein
MWWKQNRWKVIVPVVIVAVLAAAFWYGGSAPDSQGWTVDSGDAAQTEAPSVAAESESPEQPVATEPEETPDAEPDSIAPDEAETPAEPDSADDTPEPAESTEPSAEEPEQTTPAAEEPAAEPSETEHQESAEPQDDPNAEKTCTLSISCAAVQAHLDWLDPEKTELVPSDGWILPPTEVVFYEGESVFNVLQRTCKQQKIHMEFSDTPGYNSAYLEGIGNLYEFDCGELSGWMYRVNGQFPNYGCSQYFLQAGDVVEWVYSCDGGADVGAASDG